MSRAQLLEVARQLGIQTEVRANGKRGGKDNNWLRTDIIDRTYGPGLHWDFKSASHADETMMRIAAAYFGKLGPILEMSQRALRCALSETVELKRLQALTRRKRDDEARLTRSIKQWLDVCDAAQRLHETESAMRDAGHDLSPVETDARMLAQEQYERHIEATAAKRDAMRVSQ